MRCDKTVLFFAREMYILNLRSPGVTKILREKLARVSVAINLLNYCEALVHHEA